MREIFQIVQQLWQKVPFRHVLVLVVFLAVIKEQYPFSDFPMYSHLDGQSDVLYLTDQDDNVLPMEKLFGSGTSTQKKIFMTELKSICNPKKRDTRDALPEEKLQAGGQLMDKLMPKLKRDKLAAMSTTTTGLRIYYKVYTLDSGSISSGKSQLVAERPL